MTLKADILAIRELLPNVFEQTKWNLATKSEEDIHAMAVELKRMSSELDQTAPPSLLYLAGLSV